MPEGQWRGRNPDLRITIRKRHVGGKGWLLDKPWGAFCPCCAWSVRSKYWNFVKIHVEAHIRQRHANS